MSDIVSHEHRPRNWIPFKEARAYAHSLNLKCQVEWNTFCKSGGRPEKVPSNPPRTYPSEWISWADWLGTDRVANQYREFLPFEQAREYARSLHLSGKAAWKAFSQSGGRAEKVPSNPPKYYLSEWISWADWLNTTNVAGWQKHREFLPFEQAREFVRGLHLQGIEAWRNFCKSGERPKNIPTKPDATYCSEWVSWADWLNTTNVSNRDRQQGFLPFRQAREFVRSLGIKGRQEWGIYASSNQRPSYIPHSPNEVYAEWESFGDWLGTGTIWNRHPDYVPLPPEHYRVLARASSHRYRARKRSVSGTYTPNQIQEQLKRQKYKCYYAACGHAKFKKRNGEYIYHIEHTFPLSRVAGTDIPANDISYLVLSCPSCNDKKGDKFPWEWAEGGRLF